MQYRLKLRIAFGNLMYQQSRVESCVSTESVSVVAVMRREVGGGRPLVVLTNPAGDTVTLLPARQQHITA